LEFVSAGKQQRTYRSVLSIRSLGVKTDPETMGKFSRGAVLLTSCLFAAITGKICKVSSWFSAKQPATPKAFGPRAKSRGLL
jgi:hypothetical protein